MNQSSVCVATQDCREEEQGRQLARAGLVEQNLPGLSVAVGAGGDIVWAEGMAVPGGSTSFMTFPERGLVVAVTTNISFADTRSIAWQIAQAFATR